MTSHVATPFTTFTRLLRRAWRPRSDKLARRGFESGSGGRRWQGVQTLPAPVAGVEAARASTRSRAAGAYANTPYGRTIPEKWAAALAGKGWQTRCAHPDEVTRRRMNDEFEALYGPVLLGMARGLVRDGEAFVRLHLRDDGTIRLQLLNVEQVDASITRQLEGGGRIVSGVEVDGDDEVVAYWILRDPPDSPLSLWGEALRVPAADILHIFDPLWPGQVRGISWLAPVLLRLHDRDEYADAVLVQGKVAALMTGFITEPDGGAAGFEPDASTGALNVALEPGAMRILPPGASVTFSDPAPGMAQAVDFLRSQDREIAAGVGLTYEQLTGDMGEANYSSARVGLLEFRRRAEMLQKALIEDQFLRPLWRRWIELQVLSGAIPAHEAGDHAEVRFVGPGWPWVDPRSEIEAEVAAMAAGLKSREEIVAARGRDIDELDDEIARDGLRAQEGAE